MRLNGADGVPTEHSFSGMTARVWAVAVWGTFFLLSLPCAALAARECDSDLKTFRTTVDQALANHTIDKQAYEPMQKQIAIIEGVCASGDEKLARAMLINGMMSLSFGADDTYGRSVNKAK
jgi:hypothetical protein